MTDTSKPIGEIIEAETTAFIAQCLEVPRQIVSRLYDPPPFGAFVKICSPAAPRETTVPTPKVAEEEPDPFAEASSPVLDLAKDLSPAVYALVYGATTSSLEPNRRPSALGFADEDEMRRQQPQIFELLRTEFSGLLIAYAPGDGQPLRRHLPPRPPRIHSRVYECAPEETRLLTQDFSFLRGMLLPSSGALAGVPSDELAAACLRQARECHPDQQAFLLAAGKALATFLASDYERLQAILRNVL